MSSKFERAKEAIQEVWEDTSVSLEEALESLESLRHEITEQKSNSRYTGRYD